jgi:glycosyltransferase involved in cell wall biosynthesis
MRICYVTQSGFGVPGAERTHALEIIKALRKLGCKVLVFYAGKKDAQCEIDIYESRAPFGYGALSKIFFQLWLVIKLHRAFRHGEFDVCYVRQSALMFAPGLIARWTGMPVIAEFNTYYSKQETTKGNWLLKKILRTIEANNLNQATIVVVISAVLRDLILENYDVPAERVLVVHNGANTEFMRPLSGSDARRRYGIDESDFVIGFVGQLHPWQGIEQLLMVLARLNTELPNVRLIVAGTSKDLAKYQKLAIKLNVSEQVYWLGAVAYEDIPEVIATFDVAVAPGDTREGVRFEMRSPLKVYEYMSCGKPVVAARLQTIEPYFKERQAGFMVPRGSVDEMVSALHWLAQHPESARQMGEHARRIAVDNFSWQLVAEGLLESYREHAGKGLCE